MNSERNLEQTALQIAYEKVRELGYRHADLIRLNSTMTFKTLARISKGKRGRVGTDRDYLRFFVGIINEEYKRRLHCGCDNVGELLVCMKDILLKTV